jgi:hypothetical protein
MAARTFLAVIGILFLQAGCMMRVPAPSGGPPGTPRVGWVIMAGDRDNPDREFVCQSNPRTACVMFASRPDSQTFSAVHFYFHSAATDTKYTGTIQIEFFEGSTPHEVTSDVTVKGRGSPANTSVSGIVSSKPGIHPMTIAMVAESGTTQQIRERVPVTVK